MRRSQISFLLTIAATLLFLLGMIGGWVLAGWTSQQSPNTFTWRLGLPFLVLAIVTTLFYLHRFIQLYFFHIKACVDDAQLILQSNPDRRLTPTGPQDLRALMLLLNQYADHFQQLVHARDAQVQQARADLEEERNLLATLLADLRDGVIVCNRDGRILLYNRQASTLLARSSTPNRSSTSPTAAVHTAHTGGGYIGLGRSIFGLLDRNMFTFALNHRQNSKEQTTAPNNKDSGHQADQQHSINFLTTTATGTLLHSQMRSLINDDGTLHGFVLTLHEMGTETAVNSRRDHLLQQFAERLRGGLGNIRAAVEMVMHFPAMTTDQRQQFHLIIGEEVTTLSDNLNHTMRDVGDVLRAPWHFTTMAGTDLLWVIKHHLATQDAQQATLTVVTRDHLDQLWLHIDSYAVVHGLATAIGLLQREFPITTIEIDLRPHQTDWQQARRDDDAVRSTPRFAALDVRWSSQGITTTAWLAWKERVSTVDAGDATLSLREVAEQHGSEVWFQHDPVKAQSYFRLLLPLTDVGSAPTNHSLEQPAMADPPRANTHEQPQKPHSTPVPNKPSAHALAYDFALFQQADHTTAPRNRPLQELTYTVFDTETTGLDPEHDEIIAIGAARLLNGRLLRHEIFDHLVDPQRTIPRRATEIHGIDERMVQGAPTIAMVLPNFARFAEETVLLGHNVAFDLRMLAMQAAATGIQWTQPVIDTLLLSEVVHPQQQDHTLEAIAERLGVNLLGRHTALGDALVTAEIFLRMIPLLNAKGIFTLDEAMVAGNATDMARLQY